MPTQPEEIKPEGSWECREVRVYEGVEALKESLAQWAAEGWDVPPLTGKEWKSGRAFMVSRRIEGK